MGKESVIKIREDISEPGDDHLPPRCSTPIFDRCIVPPGKSSPQIRKREEKNNDARMYREWKLRLQRGKTRLFKVRGDRRRNRNANTDSSIISGHFESEVDDGAATATTPSPVYQMWFPFGYPGFCWSPTHGCQHRNNLWSYVGTLPQQIPHYRHQIPAQFFGPAEWFFANFCQRTAGYQPAHQVVRCDGNYHANSYQPHVQWPQSHHRVHHPFPIYSPNPNGYPLFLNRGTVI